jgi:hypothetical protein
MAIARCYIIRPKSVGHANNELISRDFDCEFHSVSCRAYSYLNSNNARTNPCGDTVRLLECLYKQVGLQTQTKFQNSNCTTTQADNSLTTWLFLTLIIP